MKAATPALIALLEQSGARHFWSTRCVEIATRFGVTLRYTEADVHIVLPETGAAVYRMDGARLTVSGTTQKLGLDVDVLDLTLAPVESAGGVDPGATPPLPSGVSLYRAARNGLLDRAQVTVWRAFAAMPGPSFGDLVPVDPNAGPETRVLTYTPVGALKWFVGFLAPADLTESLLAYRVESATSLLNIDFPRHVYRRGCGWDLYGAGCGVSRAAHAYPCLMTSISTRLVVAAISPSVGPHFHSRANGYFDEGVLEVRTGRNAFVRRGIKQHEGANFTLTQPLPFAPAQYDEFIVVPGCDKTYDTCGAKFSNQARFRGFPHLPRPDSLTGTKMKDVTEKRIRVPDNQAVPE